MVILGLYRHYVGMDAEKPILDLYQHPEEYWRNVTTSLLLFGQGKGLCFGPPLRILATLWNQGPALSLHTASLVLPYYTEGRQEW